MGRKKKGESRRMVTTNMRVTEATRDEIRLLAEYWGITMSEALDRLIEMNLPEVKTEMRRREENRKAFQTRKPDTGDLSQN